MYIIYYHQGIFFYLNRQQTAALFQSIPVQFKLYQMQLQFHLVLSTTTRKLYTLVNMDIVIQLEILLEAVKLMAC